MTKSEGAPGVRVWSWLLYVAVTLVPVVVAVWAAATTGASGNLYVLPVTGVVVSAVLGAIARHLGAKTGSAKTERSLFRSGLVVVTAWAVMSVWTILGGAGVVTWRGQDANGQVLSVAFLGLVTAVLGNAMPVAPPNAWFGLRVGWSSHSPRVWARTQLVAGRIVVVVGIVIFVCAFLAPPTASLTVAVALILAAGIGATLYARHAALAEGPAPEEPAAADGRDAAGPGSAGTPDPDSGSRRAAAIALTWVPVIVIGVYASWMWDRTPHVLVSHWNFLAPDSYQSRFVFLVEALLLSVAFAVFATAGSLSRSRTVRGEQRSVMALGLGSGVAAMIATAYILSVRLTIADGSPEKATMGGWVLLFLGSVLWGALPVIAQFRGELRYFVHLNWAGIHWP